MPSHETSSEFSVILQQGSYLAHFKSRNFLRVEMSDVQLKFRCWVSGLSALNKWLLLLLLPCRVLYGYRDLLMQQVVLVATFYIIETLVHYIDRVSFRVTCRKVESRMGKLHVRYDRLCIFSKFHYSVRLRSE